MQKRVTIFFSFLMLCICFIMLSLFSISEGKWLHEAATRQSSYKLKIAKLRGQIYDCNKKPLVGKERVTIAAVVPTPETLSKLRKVLNPSQMKDILGHSEPFLLKLPQRVKGLQIFEVPERCERNQMCPHIIGYLDACGDGVCGIEKAYNKALIDHSLEIFVTYKIDAIGNVLSDDTDEVVNVSDLQKKGVVLTIDEHVQRIAQDALAQHIKKGACVVLEVPTGKIRACASVPDFSANSIAEALNNPDSPLINRAFCAYNLGSVFKLVTAACALESGISEDSLYNCNGCINVQGQDFNCFSKTPHGNINMEHAMMHSCNTYFVDLAQKLQTKHFHSLAAAFGFGSECELAPGFASLAGTLPPLESLCNLKALANFSFGQGDILATPLQVAAFINAIASDGKYSSPCLIEGEVDETLNYTVKAPIPEPYEVISGRTAQTLKQFMLAATEEGTAEKGKPQKGKAGAKTSTAETGIKDGERNIDQTWYAGFYPYENPNYAIVVMAEDGVSGGQTCGPVFAKICDSIEDIDKLSTQ